MTILALTLALVGAQAVSPSLAGPATESDELHLPIVVVTTEQPTLLDSDLILGVQRGAHVAGWVTTQDETRLKRELSKAQDLGYGSVKLKDPTRRDGDFVLMYPKDTFGFDDAERQIRLMKAIPDALHGGDQVNEEDLPQDARETLRGMAYASDDHSGRLVATKKKVAAQLGVEVLVDYQAQGGATQTFRMQAKEPSLHEMSKYDTGSEKIAEKPDAYRAKPLSMNLAYVYPMQTPSEVKLKLAGVINEFLAAKMADLHTRYAETAGALLSIAKSFDPDFLKACTSEGFDPKQLDDPNQRGRVDEDVFSGNRGEFPSIRDAGSFVSNNRSTGYRLQVVLSVHSISNITSTGCLDDLVTLPMRPPYGT